MWIRSTLYNTLLNDGDLLCPLIPNLHIQILQIDIHLFPLRINSENSINFPCDDHFINEFSYPFCLWFVIRKKKLIDYGWNWGWRERRGEGGREKGKFLYIRPISHLFAPLTPLFASLVFISPRNAWYLGSPLQQSWGITCSLPFVQGGFTHVASYAN